MQFFNKFLVQELIFSPRQQVQEQQQEPEQPDQQQEPEQRQEPVQRQERQVQQERQVLQPGFQQLSERSQRKKQSSRGTGKQKVFSWFECSFVFK